jgi:hypothetical protein
MKHKLLFLFLIFVFVIFGCSSPYSGDYIETAESRKAEIQQRWNLIKPQFTAQNQNEFFDVLPKVTGPDYQAGKLKAAYLNNALDLLNFCRFLVRMPDDVQLRDDYTNYAQHGMAVLTAHDRPLMTHTPAKPADMDQEFFDRGYKGTSSSNIAMGYPTLAAAVRDGWLKDSGSNNEDVVGHRRWALNPSMAYTGFGQASRTVNGSVFTAMYALDTSRKSTVDYDTICWPDGPVFPGAFMGNKIPWSITVNPAKYKTPQIAEVNVTVTDLQSGRQWIFHQGGEGHYTINTGGYGVSNCIIFTPGISDYSNGIYRVEVRGLKTNSGEAAELNYQIEFFSLQ